MPLMPKATAVWMVDNTSLTFEQIAEFVGMHPLEISGIADGEVAVGLKGQDPVVSGELSRENIAHCEKNPKAKLKLLPKTKVAEPKRKGPKYTPLSKRVDRPAAILWLIRNHPELTDAQISRLVGTTKPTIQTLREKTHWNYANIQPIDPVALGMCRQVELDEAVAKSAPRVPVPTAAETEGALVGTDQSLAEPDLDDEDDLGASNLSADELFNLPNDPTPDEDDDALTR